MYTNSISNSLLSGDNSFHLNNDFGRIPNSNNEYGMMMDSFVMRSDDRQASLPLNNVNNNPSTMMMMMDNFNHNNNNNSVKLQNSLIDHHNHNVNYQNQSSIRSSLSSSSTSSSLSSPLNNDYNLQVNNYHHQVAVEATSAHDPLFHQHQHHHHLQQQSHHHATSPSMLNEKNNPAFSSKTKNLVDSRLIDAYNNNLSQQSHTNNNNNNFNQWINDSNNPFNQLSSTSNNESQSLLNDLIGTDFLSSASLLSDEFDNNNDLSPLLDGTDKIMSKNTGHNNLNEFDLNMNNNSISQSNINSINPTATPYESKSVDSVSSIADIASPYSIQQTNSISPSVSCSRASPIISNNFCQKSIIDNIKSSPVSSPMTNMSSCPSTPYSSGVANQQSQCQSTVKSINNVVDNSPLQLPFNSKSIQIKNEATSPNSPYEYSQGFDHLNSINNLSNQQSSLAHKSPNTIKLQQSSMTNTVTAMDQFMSMSASKSDTNVDQFDSNNNNDCDKIIHSNHNDKINISSQMPTTRVGGGLSSYLDEMAQMTARHHPPIMQQQQQQQSCLEMSYQQSNFSNNPCIKRESYNPISSLEAATISYNSCIDNDKDRCQASFHNQHSSLFDSKSNRMCHLSQACQLKNNYNSSNSTPQSSSIKSFSSQSPIDRTMPQSSLSSMINSMYDCSPPPTTTLTSEQQRRHCVKSDCLDKFNFKSPPPSSSSSSLLQSKLLQPTTSEKSDNHGNHSLSDNNNKQTVVDPYTYTGNLNSLLDPCNHKSDSHSYSLLASHQNSNNHHDNQQAHSKTAAGINKRPRGRPRVNDVNDRNDDYNSKYSISKSLIQSLLTKSSSREDNVDNTSFRSLLSRLPGLDRSLSSSSSSSSSAATLMQSSSSSLADLKRGRGRPKSLKTLLREAEKVGFEIPSDVVETLRVNQQKRQRARHLQLQRRRQLQEQQQHQSQQEQEQHNSTNYFSDNDDDYQQQHRQSHQYDSNAYVHSRSLSNSNNLPLQNNDNSYPYPNVNESIGHQFERINTDQNIENQRTNELQYSSHQYRSQHQQYHQYTEQRQHQHQESLFSSLSENNNDFNNQNFNAQQYNQHLTSININQDLSNLQMPYSMNNNDKIIGRCETEIIKNPFDDDDHQFSLHSKSSKNNHHNSSFATVPPLRISLTNNDFKFKCTRFVEKQSAKRKRLKNSFSDEDDYNDDNINDDDNNDDDYEYSADDFDYEDSNESSYSAISSFDDVFEYDVCDEDSSSYDGEISFVINRNKKRKHQKNNLSNNSLDKADILRINKNKQKYTSTGKPKFTESIMMDCLNATFNNNNNNNDSFNCNDSHEKFDNLDFFDDINEKNNNDNDNVATENLTRDTTFQTENVPKLPKLLLKRLNSNDHDFKIIQNDNNNNNENNEESKISDLLNFEKSAIHNNIDCDDDYQDNNKFVKSISVNNVEIINDDYDIVVNNNQEKIQNTENALNDNLFINNEQSQFDDSNSQADKNPNQMSPSESVIDDPLFRTPSPPPAFDHLLINSSSTAPALHISSVETILPINSLDSTKLISDNEQFSAINSIMNLDDFDKDNSSTPDVDDMNPLISNRSNAVDVDNQIVDDAVINITKNSSDQNEEDSADENPKESSAVMIDNLNKNNSCLNENDEKNEKLFALSSQNKIDQVNTVENIESTSNNESKNECENPDEQKLMDAQCIDGALKPKIPVEPKQDLSPQPNKQFIPDDASVNIETTSNKDSISSPTVQSKISLQKSFDSQSNSAEIKPQISYQLPSNIHQNNPTTISQQTSFIGPIQHPVIRTMQIHNTNPSMIAPPAPQQQQQSRLPMFQLPPNSSIRLFTPSVNPQIQHQPVHQTFLFQSPGGQRLPFQTQPQAQLMIRSQFPPQQPQMIRTQVPNSSTINFILPANNSCGYAPRPVPQPQLFNPLVSNNAINQPMFIQNGPRLIPVNPGLINTVRMLTPRQPQSLSSQSNCNAFLAMGQPPQQSVFQQQPHHFNSSPLFLSSSIMNQKVMADTKQPAIFMNKSFSQIRQPLTKDILTEAMQEIKFDDDQMDNQFLQQSNLQSRETAVVENKIQPLSIIQSSPQTMTNDSSSVIQPVSTTTNTTNLESQSNQNEVQLTNDDLDRLFNDLDCSTNVEHFDDFGFLDEISHSIKPISEPSNINYDEINESNNESECNQIIDIIIDSIESKAMVEEMKKIECVIDDMLETIAIQDQKMELPYNNVNDHDNERIDNGSKKLISLVDYDSDDSAIVFTFDDEDKQQNPFKKRSSGKPKQLIEENSMNKQASSSRRRSYEFSNDEQISIKLIQRRLRSYSSDSDLQSIDYDKNFSETINGNMIIKEYNNKDSPDQFPEEFMQCTSSLSPTFLDSQNEDEKEKSSSASSNIKTVQHPDITSSVIDDDDDDDLRCDYKKGNCCLHRHHHHVVLHHHCGGCYFHENNKRAKMATQTDQNDDDDNCDECCKELLLAKRKCCINNHLIPSTTVSINVNTEIVLNSKLKNATTIIHINSKNENVEKPTIDDEEQNIS